MASITVPIREKSHPNLRPLNVLRDLPNVADLIELCFSGTMDSEGQRYIQDMRRAGRDASFLNWATRAAESTSLPLTGYVWEEKSRIVGNVSLVPFRQKGKRVYLIANVATHPDYRRRGIARALTERAVRHARGKTDSIWLHVRDDNTGAIKLYKGLGFVERARRMTWQANGDSHAALPSLQADISISTRDPRWWPLQQKWLARLYPDELAWHRNWSFTALRPGLWNWLYLLFVDMNIRQWAVLKQGQPAGVLSWVPSGRGESLYLAASPTSDPEALTGLLLHARRTLSHQRYLSLEFPVGVFDAAILNADFRPQRTLIWMQATS